MGYGHRLQAMCRLRNEKTCLLNQNRDWTFSRWLRSTELIHTPRKHPLDGRDKKRDRVIKCARLNQS